MYILKLSLAEDIFSFFNPTYLRIWTTIEKRSNDVAKKKLWNCGVGLHVQKLQDVNGNITIKANFREICEELSELKGAYISPEICTNELIFGKACFPSCSFWIGNAIP